MKRNKITKTNYKNKVEFNKSIKESIPKNKKKKISKSFNNC